MKNDDYNKTMGRFTRYANKVFDMTDDLEYQANKLVPTPDV